jgi:hypothetical protein
MTDCLTPVQSISVEIPKVEVVRNTFRLRHDSPAVNVKGLAGHMSAGIASEEGHGFGDVLRFSSMAEWNPFGSGFPLGVGVSRPDARRGDAAGSHHIGAPEQGELER